MKACFAALLGCAAFLALAAAALEWGTVRGDGRVITGCEAEKAGSLQVVDGQDCCSLNEIRATWNSTAPKGDPGILEPAGPAGHTGATGRDGMPEKNGDRSEDGASGPVCAHGERGPQGDTGAPGVDGDRGPSGTASAMGEKGSEADSGAPGVDGDKGAIGEAGPSGAHKGPRDDNGAPGAKGESRHARAPPTLLSEPRIGPGA
jgi:hypothetical protein